MEKFFSLISSPATTTTKIHFSGAEKRQVFRNSFYSSDQSLVLCNGVLVQYCDVRLAKESLKKYMDIPQLEVRNIIYKYLNPFQSLEEKIVEN